MSGKQRYSSVYLSAIVRRIDREDGNRDTTAVVVEPGGRKKFIPLKADRILSMEPVGWTFDEIVGTTVHDPSVSSGHYNIQLRRRYDAHKFVRREHIVFPCKIGIRPSEVFTHACKF